MRPWMILKSICNLNRLIRLLINCHNKILRFLPINPAHVLAVLKLPFKHRDPFDRLLIGQTLVENMKFISNEALFLRYGEDRIW